MKTYILTVLQEHSRRFRLKPDLARLTLLSLREIEITGINSYYTKFGRILVRQTVQNCDIDILTQDVPECIDHIAVSKGFAGERAAVAE